MSACYVWKDSMVKVFSVSLTGRDAYYKGLHQCFIVDTAYSFEPDRVGRFVGNPVRPMWEAVDPKALPEEFRTYLLLLGVTI